MTEDQIKHMVSRFLQWRLPENFNPDCGISFEVDFNVNTAHPMKHQPVSTNLFDAVQADAMVRHMIDGLPAAAPTDRVVAWLIERKSAHDGLTRWYAERSSDGWHCWVLAASMAKPFASEAEAKAYPAYQMIASDPAISITEHLFMGRQS